MNEIIFFKKFPELWSLSEEKRQQVYAHFRSAPEELLDHCSLVTIPEDTVFIREGQPASRIFIIAEGAAKAIDYRVLGVEYAFIHFTKAYTLGGMEILMDLKQYRTTLKTITPCLTIQIAREPFERWLLTDAAALKQEAGLMGEYLLEQGRLAREYLFLPGPERLAKLLIRKYEKYAVDGVLVNNSSRQALANETGFGIKTVNRAVKTLADAGYITKEDRVLTVNHQQYISLKNLVSLIIEPET